MTRTTGRRSPNQWWVGLVAGMASYIDATALIATGIALTIYQFTIGVTPEQLGIMSGALTLSVALGAVVGGWLGDRLGRRTVFLVTMGLIVLGSAATALGATFPILLAGVILIGLGVGADLPVSLATIAEAASDEHRGKLIAFSNILWAVGIVASILIASFSGPLGRLGGQILFGHIGVVAAIVLVLRWTLPESEVWLEARARRLAGDTSAAAPRAGLRDLLAGPYLVPFLALLGFYTLTNLGANTTGSFNTFIAANFAGSSVEEFNRWALLAMVLGMIPGFLFMKIVDGKHRMPFFWLGAALAVSGYVLPAVAGVSLMTLLGALALGMIGNAFAFEGIMKVWTQESFPTMLRSTAQGSILAVARVAAALLASVTPALLQANITGVYVGLAVITGIGYLIGGLAFRGRTRNEFHLEGEAASPSTPASIPAA